MNGIVKLVWLFFYINTMNHSIDGKKIKTKTIIKIKKRKHIQRSNLKTKQKKTETNWAKYFLDIFFHTVTNNNNEMKWNNNNNNNKIVRIHEKWILYFRLHTCHLFNFSFSTFLFDHCWSIMDDDEDGEET